MGKLKCVCYVICKIICLGFVLNLFVLDVNNKDIMLEYVWWKSVVIVFNGEMSVCVGLVNMI